MLFFFLFFVFAHPFENNLFGHQIVLNIQEEEISLNYDLEMPTGRMQDEYSSFDKNGKDKREEFVQEIYAEIISSIQLEINEEVIQPTQISHKEIEIRNKGKFMVFSSQIIYPISVEPQTISLVNQNRIIDPAIYKNEVNISQKWTIADTDMVIWKDDNPHSSLMKEWKVEEELREIRISFFENNWWTESRQWWNEELLNEEPSIGLWSHLKRQNQTWLDDWKQGRTSLFSFLILFAAMGVLSLFQMPIRKWEVLSSIALLFLLWMLPFSWGGAIQLTYLFLCLAIILGIFRQELAFSFWLWSFLILWIYPKYLVMVLGLPIFLFARKGRKIRSYSVSALFFALLILFYFLTRN